MTSLLFPNLSKGASDFLLASASGKYDGQLAEFDKLLSTVGAIIPQALVAKEILDGLVALNKATAPVAVVPDKHGGYIPAHGQSIYDPVTGEFTGEKT